MKSGMSISGVSEVHDDGLGVASPQCQGLELAPDAEDLSEYPWEFLMDDGAGDELGVASSQCQSSEPAPVPALVPAAKNAGSCIASCKTCTISTSWEHFTIANVPRMQPWFQKMEIAIPALEN